MKSFLLPALLLLAPSAEAQTVFFNPSPVTLQNGKPAMSADVNGNFAQVVTDGNAAKAAITSLLAGLPTGAVLPSGAIVTFDVASCPPGFQVADGSSISGNAGAGGAGSAPDVRGLFIRGLDTTSGQTRDPGRTLGSYQADAIRDHQHNTGGVNSYLTTGTAGGPSTVIGTGHAVSAAIGTSAGLGESRPAAVILLPCYKP